MKKLIYFITFVHFSLGVFAQTYYVRSDSILFYIKVEVSKKDSIEKILVGVKNNSNTNLFLCKKSFRDSYFYLNNLDGPLIIACGCEYGFNQDYNRDEFDSYSIVKVNSKDSVLFELSSKYLNSNKRRKMSVKEFSKKEKLFEMDYVLSNSLLLFYDEKSIYRNFVTYKKTISFFVASNR